MPDNKLAEMYVEVIARTDKLERDLNRLKTKTASTAKSMSNSFSGIKGALAGIGLTVGFTALLGAFRTAIKLAAEQQRVERQLEQTIRSTGGAAGFTASELKKMAAELQKVTTYGDETIIAAQSLLLTFTKIGNDIFPKALEAVLDVSTAMGTDLKSSVIQIGKALNDPIKGMAALSKSGIQFSETQKKLIEGFVKAGDVIGAQKIILDELSVQFGGSARTAANTFAGKMQQLSNKAGDFGEQVGFALIPTLEKLAKQLDLVATSGQNASAVFIIIEKVAQLVGNIISNGVNALKLLWTPIIAFAKAGAALAEGDFRKMANIAEEMVYDTGTNLKNFGNGAVDTFADIFKASEQAQGSLRKFAEFDFDTGKIKPVVFKTPKINLDDGDDGDDKKLTNVQETIKAYKDLKQAVIDYQVAVSKETNPELKAVLKVDLDNLEKQLEEKQIEIGLKIAPQDANSLFAEIEAQNKADNAILLQQESDYQQELQAIRDSADSEYISRFAATNETAYKMAEAQIEADLAQMIEAGVSQEEATAIFNDNMKNLSDSRAAVEMQNAEIMSQAFGNIASAFPQHTAAYKSMAVIEATIAGILAVQKALASGVPPFNFIAAAAVGVATAANVAKIIAAHSGGVFEGGKKIAKFAGGGSFTVPQGFPKDSFPMLVESGERVSVTPKNKVGNEFAAMSAFGSKLDAVNRNLALVQSEIKAIKLEVNIDGKNLVRKTTKPAENKLARAGVDLSKL